MTELYALEIVEMSKHAPSRVLCRTDLYTSEEKAKEALLNVNTRTVFAFLYDLHFADDPPLSFEGDYDDIDDYANAYFDGVEEVVDAVNSLFAWIKGEQKEFVEEYWLEFGMHRFVAHLD
jgi:hypothetical protein